MECWQVYLPKKRRFEPVGPVLPSAHKTILEQGPVGYIYILPILAPRLPGSLDALAKHAGDLKDVHDVKREFYSQWRRHPAIGRRLVDFILLGRRMWEFVYSIFQRVHDDKLVFGRHPRSDVERAPGKVEINAAGIFGRIRRRPLLEGDRNVLVRRTVKL